MPKFRTGREYTKKRMESGGKSKVSGYVNFFRLADGESAYVRFTTDATHDLADVTLHRMVKVRYRDEKDNKIKDGYADFVSREPGLFDDGGDTDWQDIIENKVGHAAKANICGLAVILEPVFKKGSKSKRISDIEKLEVQGNPFTTKDGNEIFFPTYQLVFQSGYNFWKFFDSHELEVGPITENAWKINREGGSTDTAYLPYELKDVPITLPNSDEEFDFEDSNIPSLEDVLEMLGSAERYEKYFGDPDLWVEQPHWARPESADSDDDDDDDDDDKASDTEEDSSDAKSEAFKRLKRRAGAK